MATYDQTINVTEDLESYPDFSAPTGGGGGSTPTTYVIIGDEQDNTLSGGRGDDLLIGGAGDDTLSGGPGNGNDTFQFDFFFEGSGEGGEAPLSFINWLDDGYDIVNMSQGDFSSQYTNWIKYLVDGWLRDLYEDIPDDYIIDINQNDANGNPYIEGISEAQLAEVFGDASKIIITAGRNDKERYYSDLHNDFDWGGETVLTSNDGDDTITDFKNNPNNDNQTDMLRFVVENPDDWNQDGQNALEYVKSFFEIEYTDVNDDGLDDFINIRLKDESWSVTIDYSEHLQEERIWDAIEIGYYEIPGDYSSFVEIA